MCYVSILAFGIIAGAERVGELDQRAARKASDAFMGDLVANRVAEAIADVHAHETVAGLNRMLDSCGRPIGCNRENDGVVGEFGAMRLTYICKRADRKRYRFHLEFVQSNRKFELKSWGCGDVLW
jgi:hypothetical protein